MIPGEMTIDEAREVLLQFNLWRRDDHVPNAYEMPHPVDIGVALDLAIDVFAELIEMRDSKVDKSDLKGFAAREAQG